ncbi:MAG TPA: glycosyltransferase, partial [Tepidisphaeraceae bacterium]|nr:glycosyltransferase [Tepidisphaeraceae bacterium]
GAGGASAPEPAMKVALVHDFLYTYAGAERVLEQILTIFPQADLFSLVDFLPADGRDFILNKPVRTSFLQHMPLVRKKHRTYLPLMPFAIEQLDVSGYDIVISSSYIAAKGVVTRSDQLHVCYCHTPARFAWDQPKLLCHGGLLHSLAARLILHYFRGWDVRSANGVDVFVSNSRFVGRRVEKAYRRHAVTIYPPVDTHRFLPAEGARDDYYVTVSRLVPYKRVDLIVEAFNRMPRRRLIVVGTGPEFRRLRAAAGPNVQIVGHQPPERLHRFMQLARGFVFAAEEDFGIAPVEAQACGTPVIAFGRGGVTESVVAGRTGVFFHEQSPESLMAAVDAFERVDWDAAAIRQHAHRFSVSRFRDAFASLVEQQWADFKRGWPRDDRHFLAEANLPETSEEIASALGPQRERGPKLWREPVALTSSERQGS